MADIKDILELQERVLTENRDFIIKHLDADDVIDELIQARLMGKNSAQKVELVTMSRRDKNRIICEQLSTAGPGALEKFCDILKKESRQTFIAEQLEKCFQSTSKQATVVQPCVVDVRRLKSRYLRQLPTAKTDWPKHKVTQYVRLALVKMEDVTLKDDLNDITKLTLQGDIDRILKKKQPLGDLREIFHYQDEPCPRLIVIMGGPGIGKTTLANEICLRWAMDGFLSEDFDAVVLIPLRCVQQRSLEEVMIECIGEEVYQQLKKSAGSRCLIILEGLDEMAADRQKSDRFFVRLIKDCTILEEATVIITSRPHASYKLNADRRVEVIGFGREQIEEFIKRSFPNHENSVSEFTRQLNDYPHLKSLCYVPINLLMIVDIFQCSQNSTLPSRLTELYKLFVVMILQREAGKEDKKCSGVTLTAANSESLKKMLPGIPIHATGIIFILCRLSFCGFFDWHVDVKEEDEFGDEKKWKDPKIIFTIEDLIQCGIEVTSYFDGFGLLKATHIHEVPSDTSSYNFSHLSIQEFLSSVYISLLPQQEQLQLLNEYFDHFLNIFTFLCGLTELQCDEMHKTIYSKLMSRYDVVPAVRCMYESNCTVQSTEPFTLDMIGNHLVPFDCLCVSHVISHYPVSQLNTEQCYMSDTGVEVLAKHYSNNNMATQLLEVINLRGNNLTVVGMIDVMKIVMSTSTTLRELDVSFNDIGDNGISVITEGLQSNKTLTKLNVSRCRFSVIGASCLSELLKVNNSLQELDMYKNDIHDDGLLLVVDGLHCNNTLTKLDVERCGLSVKGASYLSELLKVNNSLQELDMYGNEIGDDGILLVADGLQCNNTLTILNVGRCGLSVEGAISISQALIVNQTLLELRMRDNTIGDDGITAIAGSLSNSNITLLNVGWCGIGLIGVTSLAAALSSNQNIRELWLYNNPISLDGARLIIKTAVDNGVCEYVSISSEYKYDKKIKKMMTTLDDRRRQRTSNEGSSEDGDCSKEKSLEVLPQQQAAVVDTKSSTILRFNNDDKKKRHIS